MNTAPAAPPAEVTPQAKRLATLQAQLALRGFALHQLACGAYLVSRWDRVQSVPDLAGVQAFAQQVAGAQG